MTTGERIKQLRISKGMTQEELGEKVGVKKAAIYKYETGLVVNLKRDVIEKLAKVFEVSPSYLMGMEDTQPKPSVIPTADNIIPLPDTYKVPLLGDIACGEPILAEQNILDLIPVPDAVKGADFALRCHGDSMTGARIYDGDIVYIREQPEVENGEIAAVLIGNEATLKRVYLYPNKLVLNPENPAYEPFVYTDEELQNVRILGKAIAFLSAVR